MAVLITQIHDDYGEHLSRSPYHFIAAAIPYPLAGDPDRYLSRAGNALFTIKKRENWYETPWEG